MKKPFYSLYCDKFSAYDMTMKEFVLPAALAASGGPQSLNQRLVYLSNRLQYRQTFLQYDGVLMSGIHDERGVEQGGLLSSDEYQLVSNEEQETANRSGLGVSIGPIHVACGVAADDTVLFSNSIHELQSLLNLSMSFCKDKCMKLVQDKTHLIIIRPKTLSSLTPESILFDGNPVAESATTEHLGLIKSSSLSNILTVQDRISKHLKALLPVLSSGAARGHRANPAASLRVENLYASPILFSGLASLVLTNNETKILSQHHRQIV